MREGKAPGPRAVWGSVGSGARSPSWDKRQKGYLEMVVGGLFLPRNERKGRGGACKRQTPQGFRATCMQEPEGRCFRLGSPSPLVPGECPGSVVRGAWGVGGPDLPGGFSAALHRLTRSPAQASSLRAGDGRLRPGLALSHGTHALQGSESHRALQEQGGKPRALHAGGQALTCGALGQAVGARCSLRRCLPACLLQGQEGHRGEQVGTQGGRPATEAPRTEPRPAHGQCRTCVKIVWKARYRC